MTALSKIEFKNPQTGQSVGESMKSLKEIKVETVKVDGDSATVKVTVPGESAKEQEYKKVDGKWVPGEMVEGWARSMEKAKEAIGRINPDDIKAQKPMIIEKISKVDALLDKISAAKTAEEFQAAVFSGAQIFQN